MQQIKHERMKGVLRRLLMKEDDLIRSGFVASQYKHRPRIDFLFLEQHTTFSL